MKKWVKLTKSWGGNPAGEVIELSAEDAQSLVETKFAEFHETAESDMFAKFVNDMNQTVNKLFEKVGDAVTAQLTVKKPDIKAGLSVDDKKKSFGDFLTSVYYNDKARLDAVYSAKAGLAEGSGVTGGYTVPPEFMDKLMLITGEEAIVRPRAFNITMGSRTVQVPALDQTTVRSTGVSPYFGGMQAKWVDEAGTRPETEPTFKQIEFVAHELSGYTPVSRTLLADSAVALDQFLTQMFGKLITWHEDYSFLVGDGVGKPKGILNSEACISVPRNTSTDFKLADVANMWSKLLPASQSKAIWVMNQSVIPKLIQLADAAGRVVFMPTAPANGALTGAMPMTLMGRPVYFTEKLPALGTAGDVMLVDLSMYIVADRGSIEVAASEHALFLNNQMAWRFIKRVDGQPWLDSYITYQDGSTTVSPFVKLN